VELTLSTRPGSKCTVVEVRGVLDLASEPAFRQTLQEVIDAGTDRLVVDLGGVRLMDSSALGTLVLMFKVLNEAGGRLCLAAPRQLVRTVLSMTSVDQVIKVYDTVEAAEGDLPPSRNSVSTG
jgi:anti-sigma B factor antagonist